MRYFLYVLIFLQILQLIICQTTLEWTGGKDGKGGKWSDKKHWQPEVSPENGDILLFNAGLTTPCICDINLQRITVVILDEIGPPRL